MEKKSLSISEITPDVINNWKQTHGKLFKFTSEDGKVGYFKSPDRNTMDAASALAKTNPIKSNEVLARATFLGGDEELLNSDDHFLGLGDKLNKLISKKQGELEEC